MTGRFAFVKLACALFLAMMQPLLGEPVLKTTEERIAEFGDAVNARLGPFFVAANVPYPPRQLALVGMKRERVLEVYAAGDDGKFRFVRAYPVLAASGLPGPKLREGDEQVPEGIYCVRELNPNSRFHLSLWLNYPNEFDLARAGEEGRTEPGTEIMIHGDAVSSGCLAMGDQVAEDLFVLAALTGIENITVVLTPLDFRKEPEVLAPNEAPAWTGELYRQIKIELARYTRPPA